MYTQIFYNQYVDLLLCWRIPNQAESAYFTAHETIEIYELW